MASLLPTSSTATGKSRVFRAFENTASSLAGARAWLRAPRNQIIALVAGIVALLGVTFLVRSGTLTRLLFPPPRENQYIVHYGYYGPESCSKHGFQPRAQPARVVDVIMFNREFEVLELRLHELVDVVDTFVIVESDRSHSNQPKPLYFLENKERFAAFLPKIVHVVHTSNYTDPYARENAQRLEGYQQGIREAGVAEGDLVIVADADEIPRASVIRTLRMCSGFPDNICLASRSYYLSFEFQHISFWHYPNVVTYKPSSPPQAGQPIGGFRYDAGVCIADAGWHCSYCFDDAERVLNKLASTMHVADGINSHSRQSAAQDYAALIQQYCNGKDPLGGAWHHYEVQQSTVGLPEYVLQHQEAYQWLLPGKCKAGRGQVRDMEPGTGVRTWNGANWFYWADWSGGRTLHGRSNAA